MKNLLLSLAALLLLAACTQPDPLPEATQGGKQTFGCRVNGKPFIPDGGTGWNATKPIVVYYTGRRGENGTVHEYYCIDATARDGQGIFIIISDPFKIGPRTMNKEFIPITWPNRLNDAALYSSASGTFFTDPRYTGTVVLTRADTVRKIISGTFEFSAINPKTNEVVEVTDGRFDVRMQ
jgi:hypothetical protein